jgi:hypothetical protein
MASPRVLAAQLVELAAQLETLDGTESSAALDVHLGSLARSVENVKQAMRATHQQQQQKQQRQISSPSSLGDESSEMATGGASKSLRGDGQQQHESNRDANGEEANVVEASPYPSLYCENLAGGPRHFVVNSKRVIRITNDLFEGIAVSVNQFRRFVSFFVFC